MRNALSLKSLWPCGVVLVLAVLMLTGQRPRDLFQPGSNIRTPQAAFQAARASPRPSTTQQALPVPVRTYGPGTASSTSSAPGRLSGQSNAGGGHVNTAYSPDCSTLTGIVETACTRAAIAYYDNLRYTVEQTEKVYDEQYRETRIISWLLIVLFAASIGLAIAQFILALRAGNQNIKKSIETESKVKISKDGLEVSSSILGVILLAFSMVFFYLYLQTVYKIT